MKFWMFLATVLDDISGREREGTPARRSLWIRVIREDKVNACLVP